MNAKIISLTRYAGGRALLAIPLLIGVLIVSFGLIEMAPGDPGSILAGEHTTAAHQAFIRAQFGLDRPLWQRFWVYLACIVQGNLGSSYASGRPVVAEIGERILPTMLLLGNAVSFSAVSGMLLGVLASSRPASPVDLTISVCCLVLHSIPVFWLGQLLLLCMALGFGVFPAQGMVSVREDLRGWAYLLDLLLHLALPALTLGLHHVALIARVTRASMIEIVGEEFVRTARAKGISEAWVLGKHALGNALIPVVHVVGTQLAVLFTGALLTETVFGWPGLGRLLFDAVLIRDYPLLLGIFVLTTAEVVVANLLADVVGSCLDPRVSS
jgi:peptide/nickel transport system permease protein